MFPNSAYAVPVGSFQNPVSPPAGDPDEGTLVSLCFNQDYAPYISGALTQLLLQSTWKVSSDDELNLVQMRMETLISMFGHLTPCYKPTPSGMEIEDNMPLRVDCNCEVFVPCCDGTEKQLVTTDMIQKPGQPGGGSTQPKPGGGQACYDLSMLAGGLALVPVLVNEGDTISITKNQGAGTDTGTDWYCPDGNTFFGGACITNTITDALDPAPALPHMSVIAKIGSVYYGAWQGQIITVPSGIVNQQVTLLVNQHNAGTPSGSYSMNVCVTNNQAATWSHILDLTLNTWGFTITDPDGDCFGTWVSGTGFVSCAVGNISPIDIQHSASGATITHLQCTANYDASDGSGSLNLFAPYPTTLASEAIGSPGGSVTTAFDGTASAATIAVRGSLYIPTHPGSTIRLQQIKVRGVGVDQFPGAPSY